MILGIKLRASYMLGKHWTNSYILSETWSSLRMCEGHDVRIYHLSWPRIVWVKTTNLLVLFRKSDFKSIACFEKKKNPVIPAVWRSGQEDQEFKACLDFKITSGPTLASEWVGYYLNLKKKNEGGLSMWLKGRALAEHAQGSRLHPSSREKRSSFPTLCNTVLFSQGGMMCLVF